MDKGILITGANGEIGHGLIEYFADTGGQDIVALDLHPLDGQLATKCTGTYQGNILDWDLLEAIGEKHEITTIFHLASILSSQAEKDPFLAFRVNVEGTMNVIHLAHQLMTKTSEPVGILYPSSIAVYGLPDPATKTKAGKVSEGQYCIPQTMYGGNKLYCERLGMYFSRYSGKFSPEKDFQTVDFRAIRFPGIISAATLPTGGTSDFGPEMIHAAARRKPYSCFVRPDTTLPFMVMPDAVKALIQLWEAPSRDLISGVYNVGSFSISAEEILLLVQDEFPEAKIQFSEDPLRQRLVDTWPADIDDQTAREEWGWSPNYDQRRAFSDYLIPAVRDQYGSVKAY